MAFKIKKGVVLVMIGGSPICFIIEVGLKVFDSAGYDCVITGALDGPHGDRSCHYLMAALDLRNRHIPADERPGIVEGLEVQLGKDYDVIDEGDHFHIEYDPKGE